MRMAAAAAAVCVCLHGQAAKEPTIEPKPIPPRATPGDYQFHAKVGDITIAAEFAGHSIPTPGGILTTEDFVVVETALYGPEGARLKISTEDFSLRVNGKKTPLPSLPYGRVLSNVKDPEWEPPTPAEPKGGKTKMGSVGGGGGGAEVGSTPPPPPVPPFPVQRALQQRVQKAALLEGDRALPQAGLIFFGYRNKTQSIYELELIYAGPAGKVTIKMTP